MHDVITTTRYVSFQPKPNWNHKKYVIQSSVSVVVCLPLNAASLIKCPKLKLKCINHIDSQSSKNRRQQGLHFSKYMYTYNIHISFTFDIPLLRMKGKKNYSSARCRQYTSNVKLRRKRHMMCTPDTSLFIRHIVVSIFKWEHHKWSKS